MLTLVIHEAACMKCTIPAALEPKCSWHRHIDDPCRELVEDVSCQFTATACLGVPWLMTAGQMRACGRWATWLHGAPLVRNQEMVRLAGRGHLGLETKEGAEHGHGSVQLLVGPF